MKKLRIIFCGDREWVDEKFIHDVMYNILLNVGEFTVIEGEADGADKISRREAKSLGLEVDPTPANWAKYKRGAGPIRNTQMLIEKKADACVAFHYDILNSSGTRNMVYQAKIAYKPTWLCTDGPEALAKFILELKRIQSGAVMKL